MTERTITIVATKDQKVNKILSSAATWEDLKREIQNDYDLDNLKATLRSTKATLEHGEAILPEGDICIMLRPSRNKGGYTIEEEPTENSSYKELKVWINNNPDIKPYLKENKIDGRNWTQFNSSELYNSIKNFLSLQEQKNIVLTEEKTPNPGTKELESIDIYSLSTEQKLDLITALAESVQEDFEDGSAGIESVDESTVRHSVFSIQDDLATIYSVLNTYFPIQNAKRALEIKENRDLLKEAMKLEEGF